MLNLLASTPDYVITHITMSGIAGQPDYYDIRLHRKYLVVDNCTSTHLARLAIRRALLVFLAGYPYPYKLKADKARLFFSNPIVTKYTLVTMHCP